MTGKKKSFSDPKVQDKEVPSKSIRKPILHAGIPEIKRVNWGANATSRLGHDFSVYYGCGFDAITSALQQGIQIMVRERSVAFSTVASYCSAGVKHFTDYLALYRAAKGCDLVLSDITSELIENYISHLKTCYPNRSSAKTYYTLTKSVLIKMQSMNWISGVALPKKPFPNSNRKVKGQSPFSKAERRRLAYALREDVNAILSNGEPLTGYELSILVCAIALRSGMNNTPLLEMTTDSIQEHPLKDNRKLLVLYKRRGNATKIQVLRHQKKVENVQTVLPDVAIMIEHIIRCNGYMRQQMKSDLVLVYQSKAHANKGESATLTSNVLFRNITKWVAERQLKDDSGNPLKVNISRFRKTFENRVWELSGGDPFVTAALAGHSLKVSDTHYLEAPKEAEKNFNFMGRVRVKELTENAQGIEQNTPVARCSHSGQKPNDQRNKIYCTDFLACVRCRNMVVTKEDLYRLFSFYWLLIYEREQIGAKRWKRYFAHIIRIIDSEIATQFDPEYVKTIRAEAEAKPHPAWQHRQQLEGVA